VTSNARRVRAVRKKESGVMKGLESCSTALVNGYKIGNQGDGCQ
jgi:hypothetical protein